MTEFTLCRAKCPLYVVILPQRRPGARHRAVIRPDQLPDRAVVKRTG